MAHKVVAVSGGIEILHIGHCQMFAAARALGDELIIILNNDHWLRKKRLGTALEGTIFVSEDERREMLECYVRYVDGVMLTDHPPYPTDMSVCNELRRLRPAVFANGGDRKPEGDPVPEVALCRELGIEMFYNVGGGKVQSSSWILTKLIKAGL
jgi:D-beta-D-heptose 7-phosphate kinase/D-beta-D-heptose 1-phosphate adenosyltransferase